MRLRSLYNVSFDVWKTADS